MLVAQQIASTVLFAEIRVATYPYYSRFLRADSSVSNTTCKSLVTDRSGKRGVRANPRAAPQTNRSRGLRTWSLLLMLDQCILYPETSRIRTCTLIDHLPFPALAASSSWFTTGGHFITFDSQTSPDTCDGAGARRPGIRLTPTALWLRTNHAFLGRRHICLHPTTFVRTIILPPFRDRRESSRDRRKQLVSTRLISMGIVNLPRRSHR